MLLMLLTPHIFHCYIKKITFYITNILLLSDFLMAFHSKDPLGLELDVEVHVSENELMAIDEDLRPTFVKGMSCTVSQCEGRTFNSVNTLWKHWKRVHRQRVALYKCGLQGPCNFSSTDVGQVRKHQTKNHQLDTTKFQITMDMVTNSEYMRDTDSNKSSDFLLNPICIMLILYYDCVAL